MSFEEDPRPPEEDQVVYDEGGDSVGSAMRAGSITVGCALG